MDHISTWSIAQLEAAIQSPTEGNWLRAAAMEAIRRLKVQSENQKETV